MLFDSSVTNAERDNSINQLYYVGATIYAFHSSVLAPPTVFSCGPHRDRASAHTPNDEKGKVMDQEESEALRAKLYDLMGRFHRERYVPAEMLCGLTHAEMQIIRCVSMAAESGAPLRPSDVARRFGVTPSAVSQSVKKLQMQGYVERVRSDEDSRSVALVLTAKGEGLAAEGRAAHRAFMDEMFAYVGTDRIEQLVETLEMVLDFFEQSPSVKRFEGEGKGPCA